MRRETIHGQVMRGDWIRQYEEKKEKIINQSRLLLVYQSSIIQICLMSIITAKTHSVPAGI